MERDPYQPLLMAQALSGTYGWRPATSGTIVSFEREEGVVLEYLLAVRVWRLDVNGLVVSGSSLRKVLDHAEATFPNFSRYHQAPQADELTTSAKLTMISIRIEGQLRDRAVLSRLRDAGLTYLWGQDWKLTPLGNVMLPQFWSGRL